MSLLNILISFFELQEKKFCDWCLSKKKTKNKKKTFTLDNHFPQTLKIDQHQNMHDGSTKWLTFNDIFDYDLDPR